MMAGEPRESNGSNDKEAKQSQDEAQSQPEAIVDKTSKIMKLIEQLSVARLGNPDQAEKPKVHQFWTTQPVPQTTETTTSKGDATIINGPIEPNRPVEQIRQQPYSLPDEFSWCEIDLSDDQQKDELYLLLNQNYVEDVESLFRFDYPAKFLEWALRAPGWCKEWHVGVRVAATGKLVAFISAIPVELEVRGTTHVPAVEVNFLCIHKRLRSKRLAPLMIREITRRVHLKGIFQALYTAGTLLPGLLGKARYYHRPLNFKRLAQVGFTAVPLGKTMDQCILKYHLGKEHQWGSDWRAMQAKDVPAVTKLLTTYLGKFSLHAVLTQAEVAHWVLPRQGIMFSYVVETEGKVTDFISFYSLPSTVVNDQSKAEATSRIRAAYLFYYATAQPHDRLTRLVHAALVEAKRADFDVFNCVEIMDNGLFLKDLQFGEGDGFLNYYLYNWQTPPMAASEMAVVML